MTVVPAYGRDYRSKKAVLEDLKAGKDFQIQDMFHPYNGAYVSINDLKVGDTLNIRYKGLRQVAVYTHG